MSKEPDHLDTARQKVKEHRKSKQAPKAGRSKFHDTPLNGHQPTRDHASAVHLTDVGNGKRLVQRRGAELRFCHPWRKWLAWDGRRWQDDATAEAERVAKETIAAMFRDAVRQVEEIGQQLKEMAVNRNEEVSHLRNQK